MWLCFFGVLLLGTGLDAVIYQSFLRLLGAEVRFFSILIPAGAIVLAVAITAYLARQRSIRITMPSLPYAGLFVVGLGILGAFASAQDIVLHGGQAIFFVFWLVCLWFCIIAQKHRDILFTGLIISALITSLLAGMQVLHQGGIGLEFLGEPALSLTTAGSSKMDLGGFLMLRGYGLFPHPNIAFGWIALGLFAFFRFFPRWNPLQRPELMVLLIALVLGLLATGSKSLLLLGIAVAMALCIGAQKKTRTQWFALGLTLIAAGAVLLWFLWPTDTVADRLSLLNSGWSLFLQHPFGIGLSHMPAALHTLGETSPWMLQPVHMVYALLFLEIGLIGGLGWLLFCGATGQLALKSLREHHQTWPMAAAWAFVLMSSLVDHYWWTYPATFLATAWISGEIIAGHLARGTRRSYNT